MEFVIAAVVGIILIATAVFLYFNYADRTLDLLGAPLDWSDFATFFGGILGPVVMWVLLFLLIYTLRQQRRDMLQITREIRSQEMLRNLSQYQNELTHLLHREFAVDPARRVELADMIDGTFAFPKNADSYFKSSVEKLLRVAANYCEFIGAYRNELHENVLFDLHVKNARHLVGNLDKYKEYLSPIARQGLLFCKTNLEDKNGGTTASVVPR
ncbi:hypothetical protein DWB84_12460 [Saccharophagus sp. K07]|jgi:hypothetical protein|uniref:hypothetical protein n=1 Tax=Saccharophagus sp. K07 TaxID=2283636 RepID=UPI00165272A6|nr:hypothetical protein [Saccharophagus sp. K07]MBC6906275.1 hypothetical protein [Saccharophagus sp. K07]